jgi:hypothetical protein
MKERENKILGKKNKNNINIKSFKDQVNTRELMNKVSL